MGAMDAKTARTLNIRQWVVDEGGPAEFSRRHGDKGLAGEKPWAPAQVSQWISDSNPKGIGHKLAREIERRLRKPEGAMDRAPSSHATGQDAERMRTAARFLEDLFAARDKVFIVSERIPMLMEVYDILASNTAPNLVALTTTFNKRLDEERDERKGEAGSAGKDDRSGDRRSARTAKAAVGGA